VIAQGRSPQNHEARVVLRVGQEDTMNSRNNPNGTTAENKIDSIKDSVRGLVDQGQQKVTEVKNKVMDVQQRVRSQGGMYLDKSTEWIKAHPMAAVGIAFGIGYFAMRLVRR
jgi:ElaB/YqjD/DUF883 family membrane-anchored ribosome-binding protein